MERLMIKLCMCRGDGGKQLCGCRREMALMDSRNQPIRASFASNVLILVRGAKYVTLTYFPWNNKQGATKELKSVCVLW